MVTSLHEVMHRYFRDNPESVDQLFRAIGFTSFPDIVGAEDLSGDVTMLTPTPRQADSVLKMRTKADDEFVLIFEAQRRPAEEKRTRWPQYVTSLYDRHKIPIVLVVVCHDTITASWASRPIVISTDFWTSCTVRPLVLGPSNVPLPTGPIAEADLPLAVFGVITHGADSDVTGILDEVATALKKVGGATQEKFSWMIELALTEPSAEQKWSDIMMLDIDRESLREHPRIGGIMDELEAEAKAEGLAEGILTVLDARGIVLTAEQRANVLAVTDQELLLRWLRAAADAPNAARLFR